MAGKSDNTENGSAPATPKAGAAGGGFSSLTAREQEILAKSMTCLKAQPEIDFLKLANELGMKNHRSAINAWSQIKSKMGWNLKAPASPADGKAPASGKRKKAAVDEDDNDEEEDTGTPAKRAKVAAKPRKKAPATPKKGKSAAAPQSPVAKEESEEDKVSSDDKVNSDDKADTKAGVKEEQVDGEI